MELVNYHYYYYYYYYYVCCLLAGPWSYWRQFVFLPNERLINCCFPLFSIFSFLLLFHLLLFLKSSNSCVLLLLSTPFTSVIIHSMASWRRQFLLRIWSTQLVFRQGYYLEMSSSLLTSLVTFSDHFIFSIFLQHHISKFSKYFRSNFLMPRSLSNMKQCSKHNT